MYKTVEITRFILFHKNASCDRISMWSDICTMNINIRVSNRAIGFVDYICFFVHVTLCPSAR